MEESDNSDVIRFEKFLIVMTDVLANKKYKSLLSINRTFS